MSIRLNNILLRKFAFLTSCQPIRSVSKKSINPGNSFKVVKTRKNQKPENALAWRDPNFELLTSKCFPFFMRGDIGPAWYDLYTTIRNEGRFMMEAIDDDDKAANDIVCKVQACPTVLRQTVFDLFPYRNLEQSELSVITISIKPNLKLLRVNNELETEKLAQTFVLAAKNVCSRLRNVGYWADFINPFSGRPYFSLSVGDELYSNDEKFRCLDFQIIAIDKCLIVSNDTDKSMKAFMGSLFTNAPSKQQCLDDIFKTTLGTNSKLNDR